MQEDQEDADWTDESDGKEEDRKKLSTYRIPVGEFITHNLLWHIPAQEQTGKESCQRKEYLTRNKVEPIEQRLSEERKLICCTQRERAEGSDDGTGNRNDGSTLLAVYLQLLVEERGIHLMK